MRRAPTTTRSATAEAAQVSAPPRTEPTGGSGVLRAGEGLFDDLEADVGWDDDLDAWDDDDEGGRNARLEAFTSVCAEVRDIVGATLERRDPEVARTFVDTGIRAAPGPASETGPSDGRLDGPHVALVLQVWLIVAQKTQEGTDLAAEAGTWVTEVLGRSDPSLERVARTLGAARGPLPIAGSRVDASDLSALIWLTAGVVAVGGASGLRWLEGLEGITREREV